MLWVLIKIALPTILVKSLLTGIENRVFQKFQSTYSASFDQKKIYWVNV